MSCSLKVSACALHFISASHFATCASDQDLRKSGKDVPMGGSRRDMGQGAWESALPKANQFRSDRGSV